MLTLLLSLIVPTRALAWSEDPSTPEGWAWTQVKAGKVADFNEHCGETLDPHQPAGWDHPCRQIAPEFLVDVLTQTKWQSQLSLQRVRLHGAHVIGDIDLSAAEITSEFRLDASLIDGKLFLNDAHLKRLFSLDGSVLRGMLLADGMNAESDVTLQDVSFADDVILLGATVGGSLKMDVASFSKTLNALLLDVRGGLFMYHASFAGDVNLSSARVGSILDMDTASFSKTLKAYGINIHDDLFMRSASFADDVQFVQATVGSSLQLDAASFSKKLELYGISIHDGLFIRHHASFADDVDLTDSRVGLLDLTSATAHSIDLSNLSVGGDLRVMELIWRCREMPTKTKPRKWPLGDPSWRKAECGGTAVSLPRLILRNTHIEALQDDKNSWPPVLDLEGLHYERLGGLLTDRSTGGGAEGTDMRQRTPEEWADWLERDRTFSPQPFNQLASVLMAAGRRDTAETILFAGRERERNEIWNHPDVGFWRWLWHDFWWWVWLSFLSVVAGYGIGLYTFRVLWWVAGLTILGTVLLSVSP